MRINDICCVQNPISEGGAPKKIVMSSNPLVMGSVLPTRSKMILIQHCGLVEIKGKRERECVCDFKNIHICIFHLKHILIVLLD